MAAYMPPQWIAFLKEQPPEEIRMLIDTCKENLDLWWELSDNALARDDYETHLKFKQDALDEEEEINIMEDILNSNI